MNRKQRRDLKYRRKQGANLNDPGQAQEMLESLPDATLVAGINNSLDILQKRGIVISDWDFRKRELFRLKIFGKKVYFLASELDRDIQSNSKEDGNNGLQQEQTEEK